MKEVIVPADDLVCLGKEKLQEVIRCKDCKYCDAMTIYGKITLYACTRNVESIDVKAEDFCSYAERGNDETN